MASVYRKLLLLTIPATLSVAIDPLAATIDTVLIGQKNGDWLAPFSSGSAILSTVVFSLNFLVYTVAARVAQAYGQRNPELLHRETVTALRVALLLGLGAMPVLALLTKPLLGWLMELDGATLSQAIDYYLVRLAGLPFVLLTSAMVGAVRGYQRLNAAVAMIAAATVVNGAVSYVCLYVLETGPWGAALGTALSFVASVVIGWVVLRDCDPMLRAGDVWPYSRAPGRATDWQAIWQDFGQDAKFQMIRSIVLNGTFFSATTICAQAGNLALGGHQLIYQYMLLAACFLDGVAVSASTLGGEAIGAKRYKEWGEIAAAGVYVAVAIAGVLAMLSYTYSSEVIGWFTSDQRLQDAVLPAFRAYVLFLPVLAVAYQVDGVLFGAKMFRETCIAICIGAGVGYVPAVVAGGTFTGDTLALVWWAICVFGVVRAVALAYFLWRSTLDNYQLVRSAAL